jgi:hypothetical protein
MPESLSHVALKQLLVTKLKEWYGASIEEYPSSGHHLDVVSVTSSGVSIYIEIVWSLSKTQFMSDINMLQQSDADVKLVAVNPEIMANNEMDREFAKVVIAQRRQGKTICGDLLNGQRILEDSQYVDHDLRDLIGQLVLQAQRESFVRIVEASHPRSRYETLELSRFLVNRSSKLDFNELSPSFERFDSKELRERIKSLTSRDGNSEANPP